MGKWGDKFNSTFNEARDEHAMLLRCEGLTYQQISEHFGLTSREYARVLVWQGAKRLNHAMQKVKVYIKN